MCLTPAVFCYTPSLPPSLPPSLSPAGADRAQATTIADTKRPMPIITEQEAVAPEAFPNPSEVSLSGTDTHCNSASLVQHHATVGLRGMTAWDILRLITTSDAACTHVEDR